MRGTSQLLFAVALCCSALTHLESARAQPASQATTEAEKLFREGVAASEAGDYATACVKFSKSLALVPRASTMLNLAVCEAEQGKLASALERYQKGLALLPPGDVRLGEAARALEGLSERVPRLTIELAPETPANARVLIDRREVARRALEQVPLDPGEHLVLLTAPGHRDATQRVVLNEGQRITTKLAPGAVIEVKDAAPPPSPRAISEDDPTLRIAGFTVLGLGVLGAIGAGVTGGLLLANDKTIETECPNRQCNEVGLDTIDESETLIIANYVSWGIAIAGVGTGAALLIADAVMADDDEGKAAIDAVVWPGGAFVGVDVRF